MRINPSFTNRYRSPGSGRARLQAAPIRYTLTFGTSFFNPSNNTLYSLTVGIGSNTYSGETIQLAFTGNDTDVHSGLSPVSFSEIDQGVATVTVLNGLQVLQTATFLPGQVVVSADHSNNGFGFGFVPGGIGMGGSPNLLQAVYPAAISPTFVGDPSPDQFYDLTLAYAQAHAADSGTGFSYGADGSALLTAGLWSCYDFQGSFGRLLPTDADANRPRRLYHLRRSTAVVRSIPRWTSTPRNIHGRTALGSAGTKHAPTVLLWSCPAGPHVRQGTMQGDGLSLQPQPFLAPRKPSHQTKPGGEEWES